MQNRFRGIGAWIAVFVVIYMIYSIASGLLFSSTQITYSELVNAVKNREVKEMVISGKNVTATLGVGDESVKVKSQIPSLEVMQNDIGKEIKEQIENGTLKESAYEPKMSWTAVSNIILIILFVVMFVMMFTRRGGGAGGFTRSRAKLDTNNEKVKFIDVAGAEEEKGELQEIVEFLKNPAKFVALGARIPKGVLLVGPPGTGKTLLARAVAGEADVPFFSISGSDFVELYVGVGASRVRDMFEQAKKNKPCIIFIDEIDAVGRQRGTGMGGGHDEREQTLNQLLVEMDGFGKNEGIIIMAATNRPDILDPALLRPGRFDRQIVVSVPDLNGRLEILKIHSRNKPLADDVDLAEIAKACAGYSGADIENLMNEAAIFAARRNHTQITRLDIEDANLKVMMGTEKKSRLMTEKEKQLTAYHEAGHAILSHIIDSTTHIHKVSIIPRGGAGGFTMYVPNEDKNYTSKNEILDRIVVMLGGRVAEQIKLDDISTGASNDLQRATELAHKMVTKFGMSDVIGPVSYDEGGEVFIGRDLAHSKNYSEETSALIDKEVKRILLCEYDRAKSLLEQYNSELEAVTNKLIEKETIGTDEFLECFGALEGGKIDAGN